MSPVRASLLPTLMHFLAFTIQPAAGAAGIISRMPLPVAGRAALAHAELGRARTLPAVAGLGGREQPRGSLARQRTQHHVQCRANCMAKANF